MQYSGLKRWISTLAAPEVYLKEHKIFPGVQAQPYPTEITTAKAECGADNFHSSLREGHEQPTLRTTGLGQQLLSQPLMDSKTAPPRNPMVPQTS